MPVAEVDQVATPESPAWATARAHRSLTSTRPPRPGSAFPREKLAIVLTDLREQCPVTRGGSSGLGWTYASAACAPLVAGPLASVTVGRDALDIPGPLEAMVRRRRNLGRPGLVSCAISAVETALWDLEARLLDISLAGLLGVLTRDVVDGVSVR